MLTASQHSRGRHSSLELLNGIGKLNDIVNFNSLRQVALLAEIQTSVPLLQVSYFSTSPELSNKQRFEYFTRTIPSDLYQVKAMVDIVMLLKWSYISIIYEESNYGIKVRCRAWNIPFTQENFLIYRKCPLAGFHKSEPPQRGTGPFRLSRKKGSIK